MQAVGCCETMVKSQKTAVVTITDMTTSNLSRNYFLNDKLMTKNIYKTALKQKTNKIEK
jgi:outer membrane protein W